jgi:hypothetical protein
VKVLFTALHFANLRMFEPVIRELADRGHTVVVAADERETFGGQALVQALASEYPTVRWAWAPLAREEPWFPVAQKVRFALDYVRFVHRRYADAPKLRLRNISRAPRVVRWLTSPPAAMLGLHVPVQAALQWTEQHLPVSDRVKGFLATESPDVLVLASLTVSRSSAMDQLKAARALGISTVAAIQSWDHLSSKAPLHLAPDSTLVWNDVQKQEAVEMHGLPADSVVVTGAQCYDQCFAYQPSRSRDELCSSLGLDPAHPFILYVCSAMSPVPDPLEPHFVRAWVSAIRASDDPLLRTAGILIRPHPERMREWDGVGLDEIPNVALHGGAPIAGDAKADYFDSLHYSAAVVGLCTSAFLEAAILGRPVLTLQLPAYRIHQEGMAHFRYLLTVDGGLLETAHELSTHIRQLGAAIRGDAAQEERRQRFLATFVRPFGLDIAATPRFVDAVERAARQERLASVPAASSVASGVALRLSIAGTHGLGQWLLMDEGDIERIERNRTTEMVRERRTAERTARQEAKQRARAEVIRQAEEHRERKRELQLERVRAKAALRDERIQADEERDRRKRRLHRWRQWRYRLGTMPPVLMLKRGLRR